jgi:hypothetical protein
LRKQRNQLVIIEIQPQPSYLPLSLKQKKTKKQLGNNLPAIIAKTKAASSTKGATHVIIESTETKQLSPTQLIATMDAL